MERIALKDSHYNIIGYVEIKPNGDKILKDRHYMILGYYYADLNVTKDRHYNIVAHGDMLTSLLNNN